MFMGITMSNVKQDINEFAEFHEIISVSITAETYHYDTSQALSETLGGLK
ncbi:hypothetical protein Si097_01278 [Streptococcus infantarius subsp. infantarius]|nr:hypothetical protein [Streptococcus infantarius subsp. infantarius]